MLAEAGSGQLDDALLNGSGGGGSADVEARKLVILGLPWNTTEETLQAHFGQFGPLEEAVIMKDRSTGKSRGFGFVTYAYSADAHVVVNNEHVVDGRRCEAKLALPRGGGNPNRTTRIFVARIPPTISDHEFRQYFEQYGTVQDAYMPKDATKQGRRGIGFVTFSSADAVEKVMCTQHSMNGQELAIDCATPKERGASPSAAAAAAAASSMLSAHLSRLSTAAYSSSHLTSPTNGGSAGAFPDYGSDAIGMGGYLQNGSLSANQLASLLGGPLSPDGSDGIQSAVGSSNNIQALQGLPGLGGSTDGIGMQFGLRELAAARARAHVAQQLQGLPPTAAGLPASSALLGHAALSALEESALAMMAAGAPVPGAEALVGGAALGVSAGSSATLASRRSSMDHGRSGSGGGGGAPYAHQGPRIFVGKLNKDTCEADVREYFTRFGYVLDVYMPHDKNNRREHRGFGFVTFETDAAVNRVAHHGTHVIRGSVVAIDAAVPRRPEGSFDSGSAGGVLGGGQDGMVLLDDCAGPSRHHGPRQGYKPY